jgi:ribosomal protein L44E
MGSKRNIRRKDQKASCSGKRKFDDKQAALDGVHSILRARRRDPGKARSGFLTAYQCRHCGGWHIGHRAQREGMIKLIETVMRTQE